MLEKIVDINRNHRFCIYAIFGLIVICLAVVGIFARSIGVLVLALVYGCLIQMAGRVLFPYYELLPEGVVVRRFIKKHFYPWTQIPQVGILDMRRSYNNLGMYPTAIFIFLPGYKPDMLRKKEHRGYFSQRYQFYSISLKDKEEYRAFLNAYYGPFDFEENLNNWEQRYFRKNIENE